MSSPWNSRSTRIGPRPNSADLYLEGSDQHRGWFQSSLLEFCRHPGHAPYKAVLTHGFVLDEEGRKMSKSLGNTLAPQVIAEKNGADILRLWAASSDFTEDLRIGQDIIKANVEPIAACATPSASCWPISPASTRRNASPPTRCRSWNATCWRGWRSWMSRCATAMPASTSTASPATLFNFCTNELSAFYFDIRKDVLYCDAAGAARRRAARTVMDEIFRRIVTWFAPILCFTMEEAWLSRFPGEEESVHLQTFYAVPKDWENPGLIEKWNRVREPRRVVTGALELERAAKKIGSSLEAAPTLYWIGQAMPIFWPRSPLKKSPSPPAFMSWPAAPAEGDFSLPDVKAVGRGHLPRRRQMRPLLAGAAGSGQAIPPPISATAAPMPSRRRRHESSASARSWASSPPVALAADQGSKLYLLYVAGFAASAPGDSLSCRFLTW